MHQDDFQLSIIQLFEEMVVSQVGWQGFHNVEPVVVSDEAVVIQIIQICDLRPLALHNDERTDYRFLRETPPPWQREVQLSEQLVIEHGGALGCEQHYILNNFLSVDSGRPLSG